MKKLSAADRKRIQKMAIELFKFMDFLKENQNLKELEGYFLSGNPEETISDINYHLDFALLHMMDYFDPRKNNLSCSDDLREFLENH